MKENISCLFVLVGREQTWGVPYHAFSIWRGWMRETYSNYTIWWGPPNLTGSKTQYGGFRLVLLTSTKVKNRHPHHWPVLVTVQLVCEHSSISNNDIDKLQLLRWVTISWRLRWWKLTQIVKQTQERKVISSGVCSCLKTSPQAQNLGLHLDSETLLSFTSFPWRVKE